MANYWASNDQAGASASCFYQWVPSSDLDISVDVLVRCPRCSLLPVLRTPTSRKPTGVQSAFIMLGSIRLTVSIGLIMSNITPLCIGNADSTINIDINISDTDKEAELSIERNTTSIVINKERKRSSISKKRLQESDSDHRFWTNFWQPSRQCYRTLWKSYMVKSKLVEYQLCHWICRHVSRYRKWNKLTKGLMPGLPDSNIRNRIFLLIQPYRWSMWSQRSSSW